MQRNDFILSVKVGNDYVPISCGREGLENQLNFVSNEVLNEKEHSQYILTFDLALKKYENNQINSFPLSRYIFFGAFLKLEWNDTIIDFVISQISPKNSTNNTIYNITAQDEVSYLWSKQHANYNFKTVNDQDEFATMSIYFIARKVLLDTGLNNKWRVVTWTVDGNDDFNQSIGYHSLAYQYISLDITKSNPYNVLIEACNAVDAFMKVDYKHHTLDFFRKKDVKDSGYRYFPNRNLLDLSTNYTAEELTTVLHVEGGTSSNGEQITLIPALSPALQKFVQKAIDNKDTEEHPNINDLKENWSEIKDKLIQNANIAEDYMCDYNIGNITSEWTLKQESEEILEWEKILPENLDSENNSFNVTINELPHTGGYYTNEVDFMYTSPGIDMAFSSDSLLEFGVWRPFLANDPYNSSQASAINNYTTYVTQCTNPLNFNRPMLKTITKRLDESSYDTYFVHKDLESTKLGAFYVEFQFADMVKLHLVPDLCTTFYSYGREGEGDFFNRPNPRQCGHIWAEIDTDSANINRWKIKIQFTSIKFSKTDNKYYDCEAGDIAYETILYIDKIPNSNWHHCALYLNLDCPSSTKMNTHIAAYIDGCTSCSTSEEDLTELENKSKAALNQVYLHVFAPYTGTLPGIQNTRFGRDTIRMHYCILDDCGEGISDFNANFIVHESEFAIHGSACSYLDVTSFYDFPFDIFMPSRVHGNTLFYYSELEQNYAYNLLNFSHPFRYPQSASAFNNLIIRRNYGESMQILQDLRKKDLEDTENFLQIAEQIPYLNSFLIDFSPFKYYMSSDLNAELQKIYKEWQAANLVLQLYTLKFVSAQSNINTYRLNLESLLEQYSAILSQALDSNSEVLPLSELQPIITKIMSNIKEYVANITVLGECKELLLTLSQDPGYIQDLYFEQKKAVKNQQLNELKSQNIYQSSVTIESKINILSPLCENFDVISYPEGLDWKLTGFTPSSVYGAYNLIIELINAYIANNNITAGKLFNNYQESLAIRNQITTSFYDKFYPFIYEGTYSNATELNNIALYNQALANFIDINKIKNSVSIEILDISTLEKITQPKLSVGNFIYVYNPMTFKMLPFSDIIQKIEEKTYQYEHIKNFEHFSQENKTTLDNLQKTIKELQAELTLLYTGSVTDPIPFAQIWNEIYTDVLYITSISRVLREPLKDTVTVEEPSRYKTIISKLIKSI